MQELKSPENFQRTFIYRNWKRVWWNMTIISPNLRCKLLLQDMQKSVQRCPISSCNSQMRKKPLLPFLVNSNSFKFKQLNLNYAQRIVPESINTAALATGVKKQKISYLSYVGLNEKRNNQNIYCSFLLLLNIQSLSLKITKSHSSSYIYIIIPLHIIKKTEKVQATKSTK